MKRKMTLLPLLLLLLCGSVRGQQQEDIHYIGVDPAADSVSARKIMARMEEIRKTRPTVALVLSGGGAKGAAHIGVIEYLDSLEIPVDIVYGTSMGGLVGGLYALGYDHADLARIIRAIDWNSAMTDKIPRDYISYAEVKYREKFPVSFPFYYARSDYQEKVAEDARYAGAGKRYENLHLGADEEDAGSLVRDNLLGSLPSGFIFGQNVGNIFSSVTVGYQDSLEFIHLPTPFVCVATEMVTAKPKIWYSGKLNNALRSTMSIPGVFAPVRLDGMVLVDGGMRNNYPTDIARELGADIVIGVNLSSGYKSYNDLNNLGDIFSQGIDMFGRESFGRNVDIPDVSIKPNLAEYNMMSFDAVSIDTIITRGYRAAVAQKDALLAVREMTGGGGRRLAGVKAVNLAEQRVRISGIEMTGVDEKEEMYLRSRIRIPDGSLLGRAEIDDAIAKIYGTKAFDYVTYELQGENEPYRLVINCKRGPIHRFGAGARFDTEEMVALLVNVGLNVHSLQGSALDLTGKIGTNPYFKAHYYYNSPLGPTMNVTASYKWVDRNRFRFDDNSFKINFSNIREEAYISNVDWRKFDLKVGLRNDYYAAGSVMAEHVHDDFSLQTRRNSYLSLFLSARSDRLDRGYFPTKGYTLGLDYSWVFAGLTAKIKKFHALRFDARKVIPVSASLDILPSLYARILLGEEVPLAYRNMVGGTMNGRYLDQQVSFIGVDNVAVLADQMAVARVDFRFRPYKNNFITATLNVGDAFDSFRSPFTGEGARAFAGVGLEYAYSSIIGPLSANLHWSTLTRDVGLYFGLGFDF